jgi:hypothetical protein
VREIFQGALGGEGVVGLEEIDALGVQFEGRARRGRGDVRGEIVGEGAEEVEACGVEVGCRRFLARKRVGEPYDDLVVVRWRRERL